MPKSKKYNKSTISSESSENVVEEASVAYGINNPLYPIKAEAILQNAGTKPESKLTALEKMQIIRSGISKKDLESLKAKASLDYDKLAQALSVTRATLINKPKLEKFNTMVSERIISLADIYSYGYEVFAEEEKFNAWMFHPNKALNGEVPFNLVDNQFGREEIKNIIGRINYGVYS